MAHRPRIVFFGTPDFAVPSLQACFEMGEVVMVVCQPDRPRGRGREMTAPPVKQWALARGLEVRQPEKLKAERFFEQVAATSPDVAVVAAYGKILPPEMLAAPKFGCVNVHGSLLPKYRGAAPIQWAVANDEQNTGVSLMVLEVGLDTGPVFATRETAIEADDTGGTMHDKLAELGASLLRDELMAYLGGQRVPQPQDEEQATYAPLLNKEDGRLDFFLSAKQVECRLRAFNPWPGTFTFFGGKLLKVLRVQVSNGQGEPGQVLSAKAEGIEIACQEDSVLITELQPEGKRPMTAAQFLAGHTLRPGDFLAVDTQSGRL